MKKLLCYSLLLLLLVVFSVIPNDSHAFEIVGLRDNNVIIKNNGSNSYDIVRYVLEAKYLKMGKSMGHGFSWKRERIRFPKTGQYVLSMDLSEAKPGESYGIRIFNHTTGQQFTLYPKIVNGKFVR